MVYQITNNVIDVKVCSISFQRHCTSLLNQQKNQKSLNGRRLNPHAAMTDSQSKQQQLPVVEIRPFTKKVWRREKSLPDFYDKRNSDETPGVGTPKGASLEISPAASRLVRELTESRKSMETRQNSMDLSVGKYRSHPKAEFSHESNKTWRKHDLIPSFITRYERTRTSMEMLSRENSSVQQCLPLSNSSLWDNEDSSSTNFTGIKVKGGKMNQHINRRHLLYLNPLESYRHPTYMGGHFNSTDNSRNSTGRNHLAPSRNSFPLTSGRARELILAGSHFNHPLKPIQREDTESPHRFNNKLGAAKCSLQILNKLGAPTKLEKALEKEYEMNLERFRKDRLFMPHDLKSLTGNFVHYDSTPTIGETFLRNAREANKPKRRYQKGSEKMMGLVRHDTSGWYPGDTPVPDIQRSNTNLVNHLLHPIDAVLHEESDNRFAAESKDEGYSSKIATDSVGKSEPIKLANGHSDDESDVLDRVRSVPVVNINSAEQSDNIDTKEHFYSPHDLDLSCIGSLNEAGTPSKQDDPAVSKNINKSSISYDHNASCNNDTNLQNSHDNHLQTTTPSTNLNSPVDSSRLETNIDYFHNLQRKSKSIPSYQPTPTPGVTAGASSMSLDLANVDNKIDQSQVVKSQRTTPSEKSESSDHPNSGPNGISAHLLLHNPLNPSAKSDVVSVLASPDTNVAVGENPEPSKPDLNACNTDTTSTYEPESPVITAEDSDADRNSIGKPEGDKQTFDSLNVTENEAVPVGVHRQPTLVGKNETSKSNSVARAAGEHLTNPKETVEGNYQSGDTVASMKIYESAESREGDGVVLKDGLETEIFSNVAQNLSLVQEMEISKKQGEDKEDQSRSLIPEDEGISITTPIEAAVLDSSMTEACSDQEGVMSGSADNGDSGISTTFITADESKEMEGDVLYN